MALANASPATLNTETGHRRRIAVSLGAELAFARINRIEKNAQASAPDRNVRQAGRGTKESSWA